MPLRDYCRAKPDVVTWETLEDDLRLLSPAGRNRVISSEDLIKRVAASLEVSEQDGKQIVDVVFHILVESLERGGDIEFRRNASFREELKSVLHAAVPSC